jgi:YVTN family beta-propeller protein
VTWRPYPNTIASTPLLAGGLINTFDYATFPGSGVNIQTMTTTGTVGGNSINPGPEAPQFGGANLITDGTDIYGTYISNYPRNWFYYWSIGPLAYTTNLIGVLFRVSGLVYAPPVGTALSLGVDSGDIPAAQSIFLPSTSVAYANYPGYSGAFGAGVFDGTDVWTPVLGSAHLFQINPVTLAETVHTMPANVPSALYQIGFDGRYVYISGATGGVIVWDTTTNTGTVVDPMTITGHIYYSANIGLVVTHDFFGPTSTLASIGSQPNFIVVDPARTFAYVTNYAGAAVQKIDLSTFTVVSTLAVGNNPIGLAIDPSGTHLYTTNLSAGSVTKIDLSTFTVVSTLAVGGSNDPYAIVIDNAGSFAYVAEHTANAVAKIDLSTFTVAATLGVGSQPIAIGIDPTSTFVYVVNIAGSDVTKVTLSTFTVAATVGVGSNPFNVAIDPSGTYAYVANNGGNSVTKINLSTFATVGAALAVGNGPRGLTVDPSGTYAYVCNDTDDTVSQIDLATFAVVSTLGVGHTPQSIAIDSAGRYAYTADEGDNTVTRILLADFAVLGSNVFTMPRAGGALTTIGNVNSITGASVSTFVNGFCDGPVGDDLWANVGAGGTGLTWNIVYTNATDPIRLLL